MNPIISFTIESDHDPISPREWDNFGTLIMLHNRYQFGDRIFENGDATDFISAFKHHLATAEDCTINDVVYLPVFMFDHSGIRVNTTSFNDNWDSGQIGYIYITKQQLRSTYSVKRISAKLREQTLAILADEINILNQYLSGDVFGFTIKYQNGDMNSCYGFYGANPETNGMFEQWTVDEILYYQEHEIEITY